MNTIEHNNVNIEQVTHSGSYLARLATVGLVSISSYGLSNLGSEAFASGDDSTTFEDTTTSKCTYYNWGGVLIAETPEWLDVKYPTISYFGKEGEKLGQSTSPHPDVSFGEPIYGSLKCPNEVVNLPEEVPVDKPPVLTIVPAEPVVPEKVVATDEPPVVPATPIVSVPEVSQPVPVKSELPATGWEIIVAAYAAGVTAAGVMLKKVSKVTNETIDRFLRTLRIK